MAPPNTVWVLGAGASAEPRFASAPRVRFPGLRDFMAAAAPAVVERYAPLWGWLDTALGISLADLRKQPPSFDIEELASILKTTGEMRWHTDAEQVERDFGHALGIQRPDTLIAAFIADALVPFHEPLRQGDRSQTYDALCRAVDPSDTIVTFNYDLLLEPSLHAHNDWSEANGYSTLHPHHFFEAGIDTAHDATTTPGKPKLLKLHGSLNWQLSHHPATIETYRDEDLRTPTSFHHRPRLPTTYAANRDEDLSTRTTLQYRLRLLPLATALTARTAPTLDPYGIFARLCDDHDSDDTTDTTRDMLSQGRARHLPARLVAAPGLHAGSDLIRSRPLKQVWHEAHAAITRAQRILIIGYSFPHTDTHVLPMLRHALHHNPAASLEIIDPNPAPILQRLGHHTNQAHQEPVARAKRHHARVPDANSDTPTTIHLPQLGRTRTATLRQTTLATYLDTMT